jgi:transposase-like protein
MEKVAPSERFRRELDEVLAGVGQEQDPVEVVGRLGARLILQQALEDEVTEFLGRRRYQRAKETVSHRNGHEPKTIKTTSGSMTVERPRVRNAGKLGFESRVLGKGVTRTHALESLVISGFLRGLSTRDVEAALEEVFEEPIASKSTVSRICEDTRERYRRWCERRLEEHDIVYLFLDAIYLKLRPEDQPAEGVLVCWGVTLEGRKVLLGLALGSRESYDSWLAFARDMIARGLRPPALVIADGAPGIWKAVREVWPDALEQRCTVHALRIDNHDQEPWKEPLPQFIEHLYQKRFAASVPRSSCRSSSTRASWHRRKPRGGPQKPRDAPRPTPGRARPDPCASPRRNRRGCRRGRNMISRVESAGVLWPSAARPPARARRRLAYGSCRPRR